MSQRVETHISEKQEENQQSNFLLDSLEETFKACLETAKRKNADYAGEHSDPFKNFKNANVVGVTVERGILVRLMDKMSRVSNLIDKEAQVKDEAITDTIDDAINYLAILKAYIQNEQRSKEKIFQTHNYN